MRATRFINITNVGNGFEDNRANDAIRVSNSQTLAGASMRFQGVCHE